MPYGMTYSTSQWIGDIEGIERLKHKGQWRKEKTGKHELGDL